MRPVYFDINGNVKEELDKEMYDTFKKLKRDYLDLFEIKKFGSEPIRYDCNDIKKVSSSDIEEDNQYIKLCKEVDQVKEFLETPINEKNISRLYILEKYNTVKDQYETNKDVNKTINAQIQKIENFLTFVNELKNVEKDLEEEEKRIKHLSEFLIHSTTKRLLPLTETNKNAIITKLGKPNIIKTFPVYKDFFTEFVKQYDNLKIKNSLSIKYKEKDSFEFEKNVFKPDSKIELKKTDVDEINDLVRLEEMKIPYIEFDSKDRDIRQAQKSLFEMLGEEQRIISRNIPDNQEIKQLKELGIDQLYSLFNEIITIANRDIKRKPRVRKNQK